MLTTSAAPASGARIISSLQAQPKLSQIGRTGQQILRAALPADASLKSSIVAGQRNIAHASSVVASHRSRQQEASMNNLFRTTAAALALIAGAGTAEAQVWFAP